MNNTHSRQGDLLIKKIDMLPLGLKEIADGVVLRGESTGHAHRLVGGQVFKDDAGMLFLTVKNFARLVHEEHKPIELSKGKYAVVRQKEYQSKDMTRLVVD